MQVRINASAASSVLLKGMEGATLGIWVAHGEGHASFASNTPAATAAASLAAGRVPMQYVDDAGAPTQVPGCSLLPAGGPTCKH